MSWQFFGFAADTAARTHVSVGAKNGFISLHAGCMVSLCAASFTKRTLRKLDRICSACVRTKASDGDALINWLAGLGAEGVQRLAIGPSKIPRAGLGIFALEDFGAEELLFSVPQEALLRPTSDKVVPEVDLAALLLQEKAHGRASFFSAYLDLLPSVENAMGHPLLWPGHINISSLFAGSSHGQRILRSVLVAMKDDLAAVKAKGYNNVDASWALIMVASRAYRTEHGHPVLCPMLDIINSTTNGDEAGLRSNCSSIFVQEHLEVRAEKDIHVGEELMTMYGELSSAELLAGYGYVQSGTNMFEVVDVPVDLCAELGSTKELRHAQATSLRRNIEWGGKEHIFEVGTFGDGGLLPVARLLSLKSESEVRNLEHGIFLQDQPALAPEREAAAHALAQQWAASALAANITSARRLEEQTPRESQHRLMHALALELLSCERLLLKSLC